ncbi:1-phosphofructokinase family hexose kinase [Parapedobacter sp. DT-150]|uniref:1-phosphofructokinase family hexose kinase n=1 Tax=Parapedobacter sp. DT-150 TaxID=3396162 RepID=UPI003F1A4969
MKHSILTITLNPTVDKSSSVDQIVPDKKLRCAEPKYEPGGGGINVSRALKRLGLEAETFFLSGGRTGALLEELLQAEDIPMHPFTVPGETRENFIVVDLSSNRQYRFGMPGEEVATKDQAAILKAVGDLTPFPAIVVISGSLPPEMPTAFLRQLITQSKEKGSKVVVDTSGQALQEAAAEGVFLLKPNLGELAGLTGKDELDSASAEAAALKMIGEGKAEVVVVSLGAQGANMYSATERLHVGAPVVKKRSTVGAGDSMVAGMVSVLATGGSYEEMLRKGVACGTATTMVAGTGLFAREEVDRLYAELH